MEVAGKRMTVMGLGRHGGGVGAARWLAEHGALVTITDRLPAQALGDSIAELAGVPIERWRLGGHDEQDFRVCDGLVVNPAVRPGEPSVRLAAESGATLTSEIELFLSACPALVVGITGSVGKSSTATMLYQILQAAERRSWLGGNIGGSLLGDVGQMHSEDVVVLELSSFQLFWLSAAARMPPLAIVTNCEPNHLDWHPTFDHYRQSKQRLLSTQQPDDRYILSAALADDPAWQRPWPGARLTVGPLEAGESIWVDGAHQRENATLAAAAASALGCEQSAISAGLAAFRGLPHRLQRIGLLGQRQFIDDSKATTPSATLAAIEAVAAKAWWMIGGADKGADFVPLIERLAERASGAAFFGATGPQLFQLAEARAPRLACTFTDTLADALEWCWQQSSTEDWIVLSPACASLDQFRDYAHRGEVFRELCSRLAERAAPTSRA